MNSIIAQFVSGLWQGNDQIAVPDIKIVGAYGATDHAPLLRELGEGWSAIRRDGETIFTRMISTRQALEQLGF